MEIFQFKFPPAKTFFSLNFFYPQFLYLLNQQKNIRQRPIAKFYLFQLYLPTSHARPTTPTCITPRTNPSFMTPSQNSRTKYKKSIFTQKNKAKGNKTKKGFLEESDEDEPAVIRKQKSVVLSILRETPKSEKIKKNSYI